EGGHLKEMPVCDVHHAALRKRVRQANPRRELGLDGGRRSGRSLRTSEVIHYVSARVEVVESKPDVDDHDVELHLVLDVGGELDRLLRIRDVVGRTGWRDGGFEICRRIV